MIMFALYVWMVLEVLALALVDRHPVAGVACAAALALLAVLVLPRLGESS